MEISEQEVETALPLGDVLTQHFFGSSLAAWIAAGITFLIAFVVLYILKRIATRIHSHMKRKEKVGKFGFMMKALSEKTMFLTILVVSLASAKQCITLPEQIDSMANHITLFLVLFQIGVWCNAFLTDWVANYKAKKSADNPAAATGLSVAKFIAQLFVWSAALLLFLDNMGFDITTLAAGLGVGGIAVALAAQNILGDLFASLTILFDKPFTNGDFIIVDDMLGSVESIGMKTTRIRSLTGEQIIISNNDLLSSRIRNYGRMKERRVVFTIGVTYDTPLEKLKEIPNMIKSAIEAQENTRFDRSHFKQHNDFSLDFESVYYVLGSDYNLYMNIQQEINLTLHEQFAKEGIEFAFPTRTLYVYGQDAIEKEDKKEVNK